MAKRPLNPKKVLVDPSKAVPMQPGLEQGDRLTTMLAMHHEQKGEQPTSFTSNHSVLLMTKNQAMIRRLRIGTAEHLLEFGWLKPEEVGAIIIENRFGLHAMVLPTPKEVEERKDHKIYIRFAEGNPDEVLEISPGDFQKINPRFPQTIRIWAAFEDTPFNLVLFPR